MQQLSEGKVSFEEALLVDNVAAFADALTRHRPKGFKLPKGSNGVQGFITKASLSSTMGPSVPVDIDSLARAVDDFNRGK